MTFQAKWAGRLRQNAAFKCPVYYFKTDGDLLPKIKNQYDIPLIKRLAMELRLLENGSGTGDGKGSYTKRVGGSK